MGGVARPARACTPARTHCTHAGSRLTPARPPACTHVYSHVYTHVYTHFYTHVYTHAHIREALTPSRT